MRRAMGIVGLALAILATGATQAQAQRAQPVKPGFDFDSVRFQTHPSDATITRAGLSEIADKVAEHLIRYCLKHPKECEEKKKKPGLFKKLRIIAKCGSRIVVVVGGNYLVVTKIKKNGGFLKLARELVEAPTREKKIKILLGFLGNYIGIEEIADGCGFGT